MGKLSNLKRFNSDRQNINSSNEFVYLGDGSNIGVTRSTDGDIELSMLQSYKFNNKNGDSLIITPKELKDEINQFLSEELDLYSDVFIAEIKLKLIQKVNKTLEDFEESLSNHINDKINSITENIISQIRTRIIDDEVNRQVEEKLEKIKELLK